MAVAVSLQLRTLPVALLKQHGRVTVLLKRTNLHYTSFHNGFYRAGPLAEATEAVLSNSSLQSLISRRDKK